MSRLKAVANQFFGNTSLHGFKYLLARPYFDKVYWSVGCGVVVVAAAAMFANLYWSFLELPALVIVKEFIVDTSSYVTTPDFSVCSSPKIIGHLLVHDLSLHRNESIFIPHLLNKILRKQEAPIEKLRQFEDILISNNVIYKELLSKYITPCERLIVRCRWLNIDMDCKKVFTQRVTIWGHCCSSRFIGNEMMRKWISNTNPLQQNQRAQFVLDCPPVHGVQSCEFSYRYPGEGYIYPIALNAGSSYLANIKFEAFKDDDADKLVDAVCVSWGRYSKRRCLVECREKYCRCSDPLRGPHDYTENVPPVCPVSRLNCLLKVNDYFNPCNCKQSCISETSSMDLQMSPLNALHHSFDPLYDSLNITSSVVMNIRVQTTESKLFKGKAVENWLTLMSNLGGVFNLFLGLGAVSMLECIYFFVKVFLIKRCNREINTLT